jgi:hypothetical protein
MGVVVAPLASGADNVPSSFCFEMTATVVEIHLALNFQWRIVRGSEVNDVLVGSCRGHYVHLLCM